MGPSPHELSPDLTARIRALQAEIRALYAEDPTPWVLGFSGGKDSTAVLQLVWSALAELPAELRRKPIHIITTDTLVESPIVARWVAGSHTRLRQSADTQGMPVEPHLLSPEVDQSFWVNLIGRGYPAPRHKFRWCTERLKINPSNRFIQDVVRQSGEAILVLGSRKAESSRRHAALLRHEAGRVRDRLSPNSKLPNSLIYTPIEDWTDQEVWVYLMQVHSPWGGPGWNRDLMTLYRGASEDNDCPLVVDTSTPSCGNSRFGCWVCTMVERDRSMEAMIRNDDEKEWMLPLLELRNELDDVPREKAEGWREQRRMSGRIDLFNGEPIRGPYTRQRREHWLRRLLRAQEQIRAEGPEHVRDIELVRTEELHQIRRLWRLDKQEFDDSLPRIYEEETGRTFPVAPETVRGLGAEERAALEAACEGDAALLELTARLLHTEQRFSTMARRVGVLGALERTLELRGFASEDEAVATAQAQEGVMQHARAGQLDLLLAGLPAGSGEAP